MNLIIIYTDIQISADICWSFQIFRNGILITQNGLYRIETSQAINWVERIQLFYRFWSIRYNFVIRNQNFWKLYFFCFIKPMNPRSIIELITLSMSDFNLLFKTKKNSPHNSNRKSSRAFRFVRFYIIQHSCGWVIPKIFGLFCGSWTVEIDKFVWIMYGLK